MNDGRHNTDVRKSGAVVTVLSALTIISILLRGAELVISGKFVNVTVFFCCLCILTVLVSLARKIIAPLIPVIAALILSLFASIAVYVLMDIALLVIMFFCALTDPEKEEQQRSDAVMVSRPKAHSDSSEDTSRYYVTLGIHILLWIFTLGIWQLVWIYSTTRFTNRSNINRSSVISLLLCLFVPFYYVYWANMTAKAVDLLALEKGIKGNTATPCLILAIFVPFLPTLILQDKINAIVGNPIPREAHFVSIGLHVILMIFTLGIWQAIWVYRTTRFTNFAKNKITRNPIFSLLLCTFVPFYNIYWTYETAQRSDLLLQERGILSNSATLCLILSIFIPFIPPIIIQSKINQAVTESYKKLSVYEETESLEKYKKLLDDGVITEEEYNAKKKQILGL